MRIPAVFLAAGIAGLALLAAACRPRGGGAEPRLVQDRALIDGRTTVVRHSPWDQGRTLNVFDSDPETLARTLDANPAVLEIQFRAPRPIARIVVTTGSMPVALRATATLTTGEAKTYSREYRDLPPDPTVVLEMPGLAAPVSVLRVEVGNLEGGDGHIHIRTVKIEGPGAAGPGASQGTK